MQVVRTIKSHKDRVASLSWNDFCLTSGSKDTFIHHHDLRVKDVVKTL